MQTINSNIVIKDLEFFAVPEKAEHVTRFFKTGKGQYSEGDIFWGINVPNVRKIAKKYQELEIKEIKKLLGHKIHEVRLCALLIMVFRSTKDPEKMFDLYLKQINFVNNWDLVDLSAPIVVGNFLLEKDCNVLYDLAKSDCLWHRRVAIVATYAFIKNGQHEHTLKLSQILLKDNQDLMHKAVGWMLREVGKRCSLQILENFLEQYTPLMPRTMLRYSIEHFEPERKKYFMQIKRDK